MSPDPSPAAPPSALDGLPRDLPALARAELIGAQAASVGFDWPSIDGVIDKVREEVDELAAAVAGGDPTEAAEELGDLLFAVCNLARHLSVPAERCAHDATTKFARRFRALEARLASEGVAMQDCSIDRLEAGWVAVKREERG